MDEHFHVLRRELEQLRAQLDQAFSSDTAYPGTVLDDRSPASAGHCAVVAAIVNAKLGGKMLSTLVEDEEHWFNRVTYRGVVVDTDLTGDQFGRAPVQIAPAGMLYPAGAAHPASIERAFSDLEDEARRRAERVARRAGLGDLAYAFERTIGDGRISAGKDKNQ